MSSHVFRLRLLVKDGDVCELSSGATKDRHLYILSDMVLCTKVTSKGQVEVKWAYATNQISDHGTEGENETFSRDGANLPVMPLNLLWKDANEKNTEKRTIYLLSETERNAWIAEFDKMLKAAAGTTESKRRRRKRFNPILNERTKKKRNRIFGQGRTTPGSGSHCERLPPNARQGQLGPGRPSAGRLDTSGPSGWVSASVGWRQW